jgi:hypothetical protein
MELLWSPRTARRATRTGPNQPHTMVARALDVNAMAARSAAVLGHAA